MAALDLVALISKLNTCSKKTLEAAAATAVNYGHYEVTIEHLIFEALRASRSDFLLLAEHYELDAPQLNRYIMGVLERLPKGNTRKPVFSPLLVDLLQESWLFCSVEWNQTEIRTGAIFYTVVNKPHRFLDDGLYPHFKNIQPENIKKHLQVIVDQSIENLGQNQSAENTVGNTATAIESDSALNQFAINFTQLAREGKIDPVFGREREIRQMVDILARRRKNNPIVVGEAGVGKTAVVEGLALKIVEKDVPSVLQDVELWSLDMGMLQAGASMKGQFEQRLKTLIAEVKSSVKPIILFIDEAHTLIGAGGSAGGGDAANLLKPALARGELRTVAATTWSEYKKYFEKDPALARRFQLVKVDEPDIDNAKLIMRGIKSFYEDSHQVYVTDDAVCASVEFAARYISGRQLPDKSVDLLDTACARVRVAANAKPQRLDDLSRDLVALEREQLALLRDQDNQNVNCDARIDEIKAEIADLLDEQKSLMSQWQAQREKADEILSLRQSLSNSDETVSDEQRHQKKMKVMQLREELQLLQQAQSLVHIEVTAEVVGKVVADWTGIPIGDMIKDEAKTLLNLQDNLIASIKGQDHAISLLSKRIHAAKAGISNPDSPLGVFLLVGPSGVGKTETAISIAKLLFGGESFLTSINMSEFQEKHTVSRLIGSPPGYVGYGEGGVLTEAVRQKPYSVVLLDEVEKADLEVMNLFYQVFDKGVLSDGEGRVIDFKNTIIILTSNLATDLLTQLGTSGKVPEVDSVNEIIRPVLSQHFKPALLARMEVLPYYPLIGESMSEIVRLKLNKLVKRIKQSQNIDVSYDQQIVEKIAQRCTEVETGARNIDYIINKNLLPNISMQILAYLSSDEQKTKLDIGLDQNAEFTFEFH